ncbi:hypothetical protein DFQ27_000182 [Actinomortierella ambigua]|uniref:Amidohydrolase-related domain-containing protein n=1 Tax=Actinomortierella ambigua TaxID=1343610 RepID=A0A9P6PLA7_9FUNG|nr:hypothetical protein DFQ27_000182 [Actinomortierella ambigua]
MCQGSVPEYFQFKAAPPPAPERMFNSRFLEQTPTEVVGRSTPKEEQVAVTTVDGSSEYRVAAHAPCPIIDAHVHIFPQKLMDAVWSFFDNYYWPVRYKPQYQASRADFLIQQGIRHVVLLIYAHRDGISRGLNAFMAQTVRDMNHRYGGRPISSSSSSSFSSPNGLRPPARQRVATGLGTVMPGEPGAVEILTEAFTVHKLAGIKMHSHVQCVAANDPSMDEVYATCIRFDKCCLIHAGKEPNSAAYKVDADKICDASIVEDVLQRYPTLKICVPHLGMNQYQEFCDLLDRYPNLYLDTTMTLGAFFKMQEPAEQVSEMFRNLLTRHADRILYGTDWPNLPYDWCRELANLVSVVDGDGLLIHDNMEKDGPVAPSMNAERGTNRTVESDRALEKILWRNAARFYGISEADLGLGSDLPAAHL